MKYCSSCGHELGVGRFCTNCGQPIDRSTPGTHAAPTHAAPHAAGAHRLAPRHPLGDTLAGGLTTSDTEERRAARRDAALTPAPPRTPPAAGDTPLPPRFPLYADEAVTATAARPVHRPATGSVDRSVGHVADRSSDGPPARGGGLLDRFGEVDTATTDRTPQEALAALSAAAESDPDDDHGRHRRGPWVLAAVVVVVVVALLVWVGTRNDGGDDATDPSGSDDPAASADDPTDLAAQARAEVPGTAPDSREADGGKATFAATNMLDGDPVTAWRVAGDASGKKIVFTFPEPVTISQVGLVNGYAKSGAGAGGKRFDWYHGNRTISKVAWVFDDRTTLDQTLERDRRLQTLDVDPVTTTTVTLRIVGVSAPGTGRASRDFTAISDVALVGLPASPGDEAAPTRG